MARSIGLLGNAAEVLPALVARGFTPDVVTDQTSAHDPLVGYVPDGLSLADAARLRAADPAEYQRRSIAAMGAHVAAMREMQKRGAIAFDYGNNIRAQAVKAGVTDAFEIPGFVPEYIRPLFCEGKGPFRWVALSGDPEDIRVTDRAALEMFAERRVAVPLDPPGRRARAVPGTAGAHLLARLRRSRASSACASTSWCATARSRRRSSSAAIISTPDRSHRRIARPKACATAATRSPTGRS